MKISKNVCFLAALISGMYDAVNGILRSSGDGARPVSTTTTMPDFSKGSGQSLFT